MEGRFLLAGVVLAITALVLSVLALLYWVQLREDLVQLTEGVLPGPRHETMWVSTALFAAVLAAMLYLLNHFKKVESAIKELAEEEAKDQLARRAMATYVATAVALLIALLFAILADHIYQLQLLEYPVFHYTLVVYIGFVIAHYIVYDGLRKREG
jgi:uncharacterized protein YacL